MDKSVQHAVIQDSKTEFYPNHLDIITVGFTKFTIQFWRNNHKETNIINKMSYIVKRSIKKTV